MLGFFYPPQFLPLALVGAALFVGLHFDRRRPAWTLVTALGAAIACGIVIFYLRDTIVAMSQTVYPGQRRVDGGGPPVMFAQTLWPAAFVKITDFGREFAATNTTLNLGEASAAATCYTLFVLAFLDYARVFDGRSNRVIAACCRRWRSRWALSLRGRRCQFRRAAVAWLGFDRVPPQRSMFASGLALLLLLSPSSRASTVCDFGWRRYIVFAALVLFGWGVTKANAGGWRTAWFPDLVVLPLGGRGIGTLPLARASWPNRRRGLCGAVGRRSPLATSIRFSPRGRSSTASRRRSHAFSRIGNDATPTTCSYPISSGRR